MTMRHWAAFSNWNSLAKSPYIKNFNESWEFNEAIEDDLKEKQYEPAAN